jgi:hypothetical protein
VEKSWLKTEACGMNESGWLKAEACGRNESGWLVVVRKINGAVDS